LNHPGMTERKALPRHPKRSEKYNVALLEGMGAALEPHMEKDGLGGVGDLMRALAEGYLAERDPDAFKRVRGLEGVA